MGEACDRKPKDEARARVRALAAAALESGVPAAWFESLYAEAAGDASRVPWADLAPNAALRAWVEAGRMPPSARSAAVVGCGLGHDAEFLAAWSLEVTAFDISPTAISWARRIHSGSHVHYEVADLFALPAAWRGRFDLVVEVYTLQALPRAVREEAARAIVSLLAPRGRLFLFARVRDDGPHAAPLDERAAGPPWPLGRRELEGLLPGLSPAEPLEEAVDAEDPSIVRAHGVWRKAP